MKTGFGALKFSLFIQKCGSSKVPMVYTFNLNFDVQVQNCGSIITIKFSTKSEKNEGQLFHTFYLRWVGNDIGLGSICFDFRSTNVVQLSMLSKVA